MMRWEIGTVKHVVKRWPDSEEVSVIMEGGEEALAFHDVQIQGPLEPGDKVPLNITAAELRLGSGGVHFVAARLSRQEEMRRDSHVFEGHMMKMRYSPFQRAVLAAEEPNSPWHDRFTPHHRLENMPVLIGELHSMLPAALCWFRYKQRHSNPSIAYVMSDGGALPISFSRHVRTLKSLGWISDTITYGHAYGGDVETINKFTALQAAKHIVGADLTIVMMGPGIAGTGTAFGHTSMETGEIVNAAYALGGSPVVIPRLSFHDRRQRHYGLSHHFLYAMTEAAIHPAVIPLPCFLPSDKQAYILDQIAAHPNLSKHRIHWVDGVTQEEVEKSLQLYPYPITTMERSAKKDPYFFLAVAAAAEFVRCEYFGDDR